MVHLVQIGDGLSRRVAIVEEPHLLCLTEVQSVYQLAKLCLASGVKLSEQAVALARARDWTTTRYTRGIRSGVCWLRSTCPESPHA